MIIIFALFHPACGKRKKVIIKHGASVDEVVSLLKEKEIIGSSRFFKAIIKLTGMESKIKAGTYLLPQNINYFSLARKLSKGSGFYVKVTIPEGFTTEQIADRLFKKEIIESRDNFLDKIKKRELRGFLYPETYYFSPSAGAENVIKTMKDQFDRIFSGNLKEDALNSELSVKELITLASLIEKEAKVPSERPIISDIFRKRLKIRMYLESCASVQFALGEHKENLSYKDLQVESPYNTYKNFGLPPTPICSPGIDSIRAAVYPADTDYMYFFTRGDGSHIFSKTYREHLDLQKKLK